ncbi:MAG: hypothetical protein Kow0029_06900 [Candidatus Rifleibacteriota bacterium]
MKIFLTLDYELFFGNKSGTLANCILRPSELVLSILNKYSVKATFFVDIGYILKLKEFSRKFACLQSDYDLILQQVDSIQAEGHDLQAHIHPHWENSFFNGEKWIIDTSKYRLHDFSPVQIKEIFSKYITVLNEIRKSGRAVAFRAGGWCIQPFKDLREAFSENKLKVDSTLFFGGFNKSKTHYFDFTKMPEKDFWNFEDDPLVEVEEGCFRELPISSIRLSPVFFWRMAFSKLFGGENHRSFGDGSAAGGSVWDKMRMLTQSSYSVVSIDGYKSSFLQKAFDSHLAKGFKFFVIIGHPKSMSKFSLLNLDKFLENNIAHTFSTFQNEFGQK